MSVLPLRPRVTTTAGESRSQFSIVLSRLGRLLELELELGVAEARRLIKSLVITAGVALASVIIMLASIVVLVAGVIAPVFGAAWQHLVIAGGVFLVLSASAGVWSYTRFKNVTWPDETMRSLEETRRWLGVQLKSKLTLR